MGSVSVTATGPVIYAIHLGDEAEFLHSSPILKLKPRGHGGALPPSSTAIRCLGGYHWRL